MEKKKKTLAIGGNSTVTISPWNNKLLKKLWYTKIILENIIFLPILSYCQVKVIQQIQEESPLKNLKQK